MRYVVFAILGFSFSSVFTEAGILDEPTKVQFCTSVLLGLRSKHSLPAVSEYNNLQAMEALRELRSNVLGLRENEGSIKLVNASSSSASKRDISNVSKRIRGIELQFTGGVQDLDLVLGGEAIRGREAIEKYLAEERDRMHEFKTLLDTAPAPGFQSGTYFFNTKLYNRLLWSIVGSGNLFTSLILFLNKPQLMTNPTLGTFGSILGLYFSWKWGRDAPETIYRRLKAVDRTYEDRWSAIKKFLDQGTRQDWIYHSMKVRPFKSIISRVYTTGTMTPLLSRALMMGDLSTFREKKRISKAAEDAAKAGADITGEKAIEQADLHVDQALFRDKDGEPVLVNLIRFSANKPDFPKKKSEKVNLADAVKNLVARPELVPIGAPAGNPR